MVCRECKYMHCVESNLYQCGNPESQMYMEYTGLCCEDDCPDGEPLFDEEDG